jgi:hypothetical protein
MYICTKRKNSERAENRLTTPAILNEIDPISVPNLCQI